MTGEPTAAAVDDIEHEFTLLTPLGTKLRALRTMLNNGRDCRLDLTVWAGNTEHAVSLWLNGEDARRSQQDPCVVFFDDGALLPTDSDNNAVGISSCNGWFDTRDIAADEHNRYGVVRTLASL